MMRTAFDCKAPRGRPCLHCGKVFFKATNMSRAKYCSVDCDKAHLRALGPARFWAKVEKTDTCWLYMGFRKWDGYGWLCRSGKNTTAHRYAWTLTHGEPPAGVVIMHSCDVPACCNPAHLRLGTHEENMADMRAKGRSRSRHSPKHTILHPERERPRRAA